MALGSISSTAAGIINRNMDRVRQLRGLAQDATGSAGGLPAGAGNLFGGLFGGSSQSGNFSQAVQGAAAALANQSSPQLGGFSQTVQNAARVLTNQSPSQSVTPLQANVSGSTGVGNVIPSLSSGQQPITPLEQRRAEAAGLLFGPRTPEEAASRFAIKLDAQREIEAAKRQLEEERKRNSGTEGLKGIVQAGGLTPSQRSTLQQQANERLARSIEAAQNALGRRFARRGISDTGVADAAFQNVLGDFARAAQAAGLDIDRQSLDLYFRALSQLSAQEQQQELLRLRAKLEEEAKGSGLGKFLGGVIGTFAGSLAGKAGEKLAESLFS